MHLFHKISPAPANAPEVNTVIGALAASQGRIFSSVIDTMEAGMSTHDVAELARRAARDEGVEFYFREKLGFPDDVSICRNHEIMNGIPRPDRVLRDGDVVKIAFGLHRGMRAFCSQTWTIQLRKNEGPAAAFLQNTQDALAAAIGQCIPGATVSALARRLRSAVSIQGDFLSREFAGCFIGSEPMMAPILIENSGLVRRDWVLTEGSVVSLLALTHPRKPRTGMREDKWTSYDMNGVVSACFSHLVQVTRDGPLVLTASYPA
jgi:methionyl aminopeptidase